MSRARVLLAKPGLDGHNRGIHVVARSLRDAGYEVVLTGLRADAESIARTAIDEDVSVVGLSVLSGTHIPLTREVVDAMNTHGCGEIPLIVGGSIPVEDREVLEGMGVRAVFDATSSTSDITAWMRSVFPA